MSNTATPVSTVYDIPPGFSIERQDDVRVGLIIAGAADLARSWKQIKSHAHSITTTKAKVE